MNFDSDPRKGGDRFFDIFDPSPPHTRQRRFQVVRGGGPDRFWPTCVHGLVHNLLMQVFILGRSKTEVCETEFFDIVTTHNDHPSYVKHISGSIHVFFTGMVCVVGGSSQGIGTQCAYIIFTLVGSKVKVSRFFSIPPPMEGFYVGVGNGDPAPF